MRPVHPDPQFLIPTYTWHILVRPYKNVRLVGRYNRMTFNRSDAAGKERQAEDEE